MKKKRLLSLLIVFLCLPSFVSAVEVVDEKGKVTADMVPAIIRKGDDGNYDVEINGKRYDAYCIDKGMKAGTGQTAVCSALGNDTFGQAFKRLLSTAKGTAEDKTAMRFLGIITGYTRQPTAKNWRGSALREQLIDEIGGEITNNHNAYIRALEALFGYNVEDGDISEAKADQLEKEGAQAAGLKFTVTGVSGGKVTISITSTTQISKMKFSAQGGSLVSSSWNGKSGTAEIMDDDNDCNVALQVAYNGSDAMFCTREGSQAFIVDSSSGDGGSVVAETGEGEDGDTTQTFGVTAKEFEKDAGYYKQYCTDENLCPEVVTPAPDLQNCCEKGGYVDVTEPELNDLFCTEERLGVEYFKRRKGSDKYIKTNARFAENGTVNSLAKDFCTVYCTQRAYIDIPKGVNHSKNGLYFELEKGEWGTASAFEQGTKRCRVRIDYDAWWNRYKDFLEKEIKYYNEYQENAAVYRYIDDNSDCMHNSHDTRTSNFEEVCGEPNIVNNEDYFVLCHANPTTATNSCYDSSWHKNVSCTATRTPDLPDDNPIDKTTLSYTFADLQHQPDYYYYKIQWDQQKYDRYERIEVDQKKLDNKVQADSIYTYRSIAPKRVKDKIIERDEAFAAKNDTDASNTISYTGDGCGTCGKPDPETPKYKCQKSHQRIEDYAETDWIDSETPWIERKNVYLEKAKHAGKEFVNAEKEARKLEMALDSCNAYFFEKAESYLPVTLEIPDTNGRLTEKNYKLKSTYAFDYTQIYLDPYGNLQEFVTNVPFDGGCEIDNEEAETIKSGSLGDHGRTDIWGSYYSQKIYNKFAKEEYYDDFYYGPPGADSEPKDWIPTAEDDEFYKGKQPNKWYDQYLQKHVGEIEGGIFKNDKKFTLDGRYRMHCVWDETGANLNTFVPSGSAVPIEQEENITYHGVVYSVFLSTLIGKYDTNHHIGCIGENCVFDEVVATGPACAKPDGGGDYKHSTEDEGESAMSCALEINWSIVLTGKCIADDVTARIETCEIYGQDANLFEFKVSDPADILPGYEGLDYADNWKDEHGRKAYNQIKADATSDATYSIKHLTYSFIINPQTMKLIQSYNAEATVDGGYSDFQMSCNCGGHACVKCASKFITNFVNGTLITGSSYKTSEVWGNNSMSLNQVRSSNAYVHWKENE